MFVDLGQLTGRLPELQSSLFELSQPSDQSLALTATFIAIGNPPYGPPTYGKIARND